MIIASYVRECDEITMEDQINTISNYCRSRKLSISKKYAERSKNHDADTAFKKLKDDCVTRAFDEVVFYSFGTFGNNPFKSYDLLSNAFIPAGIHFVSVSDGYESSQHSKEENAGYLMENFKSIRRNEKFSKSYMRDTFLYRTFYMYGYVLDENLTVRIDDSVADIVKEVFSRALAGEKHTEISKDLNCRGIDSPAVHHLKLQGKQADKVYKWNPQNVIRIITSPIYAGEKPQRRDLIEHHLSFSPYISKDDFAKIQNNINSYKKKINRTSHIFSTLIFDKESGVSVSPLYSKRKKADIFQTVNGVKTYPGNYLTLDYIIGEVNRTLMKEREEAGQILKILSSQEETLKVESLLQRRALNMKMIYAEMLAIADQLMPNCNNGCEHELRDRMAALETEFSSELERYTHYEIVLSSENPWLKLYATYDPKAMYERDDLKRYIDKIFLYRFQTVEVVLKEQNWKQEFQKEWTEINNGTEK